MSLGKDYVKIFEKIPQDSIIPFLTRVVSSSNSTVTLEELLSAYLALDFDFLYLFSLFENKTVKFLSLKALPKVKFYHIKEDLLEVLGKGSIPIKEVKKGDILEHNKKDWEVTTKILTLDGINFLGLVPRKLGKFKTKLNLSQGKS